MKREWQPVMVWLSLNIFQRNGRYAATTATGEGRRAGGDEECNLKVSGSGVWYYGLWLAFVR